MTLLQLGGGSPSQGKALLEPASNLTEPDASVDPKQKCYSVPDAGQAPDPASSHGMMLQLIGSDKRVVEFGCATGYMSQWLVAARCRVTGVEVDPVMAAQARGICDEVVVADLDIRRLVDLLPGAAFDVAVFGDVLEHLRDPWRVLDETRSVLAPGGSVVISIPNVAHGSVRLALLRGAFDYQELGLLDNTHLRFFTLKTVRELCMRAGYRIDRIDRTKAALFAPTDTMPILDPNDFDPQLIAEIASDPEHDTFQFIVRALPLSDDQRLEQLVASHSEISAKLNKALREIETLEARLAAARERAEIQSEQELLLVERSMVADRESQENERLRGRVMVAEHEAQRLAIAIDSEQLKTQELDNALRETIALFVTHANAELDSVRSDISQLDRAIANVQRSYLWSIKLLVRRVVSRLRRLRRSKLLETKP